MSGRGPAPDRHRSDAELPRPAYVGPASRRAFCWVHGGDAPSRGTAVILLGSPGAESTGIHRALRHWADHLAAAGFTVMRPDFHGTGDSAGSDNDPGRVRAWMDTVGDCVDAARAARGIRSVVVAGVRLGGTVAMDVASTRGDIDALILWAPFASGRAYLREGRAFTQMMATVAAAPLPGGAEQIGGHFLSAETVAALDAWNPLPVGTAVACPVMLVPRDESTADGALVNKLVAAGAIVERRALPGYADVMVDAHQSRVPSELIAGTTEWLAEKYPASSTSPSAYRPSLPIGQGASIDDAGASYDERSLRFGDGGRLVGILTTPRGGGRRTGILLTNAGAVHRVGPNRFYVEAAREWAGAGYTVLRMDLGGLGDSMAPPGAEEHHTYPDHAVGDVAAGVAELRRAGAERVVVAGLCSGAHTSFHAGLGLEELAGLLVVNPIVFYWKPSDPLDVAAWKNYNDARYYSRSARDSAKWKRLVTGKVDVGHVARVAAARARDIARARAGALLRALRGRHAGAEDVAHDLQRMLDRGVDVMLLFSEGEPGLDFLELNHRADLRRLRKRQNFAITVVPDADHTFTAIGARRRALAALTEHLTSRHP